MKKINIELHKQKAAEMLSKMTYSQKLSQLRHHSKAIKKLGIKEYNWWNECLHGVARAGLATVFPQAIAMAATFDEKILFASADIISTEARAKYNLAQKNNDYGRYKGLTFWTPNINIFRDPRWGRGQETYGECPTLTSKLGVAFIKGLQGNDDKYLKTSACAKHFAVHSGPEAERHYFDSVVTPKDLHETYLPAFESAVVDAGVESIMTAYNRVNSEPCSCSATLLQEILRKKWNFDGHIVSDCGAVGDIIFKHRTYPNPLKATQTALINGLDLECGIFYSLLSLSSRHNKKVAQAVDRAVVNLLTTRSKLGMFDNDCPYDSIDESVIACQRHEEYAINVAEKSVVLLKNNGVLPLANFSSAALFGYNATNDFAYLGNYFGTPSRIVTVYDAIKEVNTSIAFSPAFPLVGNINSAQKTEYANALNLAKDKDIILICTGIDSTIEGEAGDVGAGADGIIGEQGDRKTISLPTIQIKFIEDIISLGKKIVILNFSGSAISFSPILDRVDAIMQCWYPGAKGGVAIKNLLLGKTSPSGKLPITFYEKDSDLMDYRDYSMANRTYRYFSGAPQFPFGFGMSYTNFAITNLVKSATDDKIQISVDVKNIGNFDCDEVVQVYLSYPKEYANQPVYKLIHFKRISIAKASLITYSFELAKTELFAINEQGNKECLKGTHTIHISNSLPSSKNTLSFDIEL